MNHHADFRGVMQNISRLICTFCSCGTTIFSLKKLYGVYESLQLFKILNSGQLTFL